MKSFLLIMLLTLGIACDAGASVWKWVDADGYTHFVDSNRPIYTWVDKYGKVHYSDKPDHEDAISVQLIFVSSGTVDRVDEVDGEDEPRQSGGNAPRQDGGIVRPGESDEDRVAREAAEEYYCKRATEIYAAYINAPRLYRTNDDGEREFLSDEEAAAMVVETKGKLDSVCK